MTDIINVNPQVLESWQLPSRCTTLGDVPSVLTSLEKFALPEEITKNSDISTADEIDPQEIYDLIATMSDPEHPLSLGQLNVVNRDRITVLDPGKDEIAHVKVEITPTITHCSLATLIGLGIRVRLERSLPQRFRVEVTVTPGSHQSEQQVNRQLNDKERAAAACENEQLLRVIGDMLSTCE